MTHPARQQYDPNILAALDEISSTYGVHASVEEKKKSLLKFGRNQNVGSDATAFTLWWTGQDNAHETYVADGSNAITTMSGANAGDTQTITIEGHTSDTDNHGVTRKNFVVQSATLEGQGKVPLDTPLNRVTRAYNASSTVLAGEVFIYEDTALTTGKPTDTTKIHITIPVNSNQSFKAATALSWKDYWLISSVHVAVLEKAAAFGDVDLQVREQGGVFRTVATFGADHGVDYHLQPFLIAPANSDVRLTAVGSGASTDIAGSIHGYLAIDMSAL